MSKSNKVFIAVVLVLGFIQFIPHTITEVGSSTENTYNPNNAEVQNIIDKACMDCHSNQTQYPWYASITPVNYFLEGHINEGREHLNFSEWNTYPAEDQKHVAKEIVEMVEKKEMPMLFYWLIHWDAKITDEERKVLTDHFSAL
jgi:uncharacterized membrane protein